MKSDQTIIRKNHMEQLDLITKLLDIKDPNIQILDIINKDTHKEIIAKLEATNNLIKLIKRNAFGFRNFENFKKRIFIALNIKKERTKFVLSRYYLFFNPLQLTKSRKKSHKNESCGEIHILEKLSFILLFFLYFIIQYDKIQVF